MYREIIILPRVYFVRVGILIEKWVLGEVLGAVKIDSCYVVPVK